MQKRIRDIYKKIKLKFQFLRHSDSNKKFFETDTVKMMDLFLIDNIFVMFGGHVFQNTIGIHLGTNSSHFFMQGLLKKKR